MKEPRTKKYNKKRYVPYDAAKIIVQAFGGITSRAKYWKWYDKQKPPHLPKYPNRTYPDWASWNDFLGVDNSFEKELNRKRKITRGYWESVRWVQAQGYKDQYDYKRHYENGDVPLDIPKAPNAYYPEWQGWGVWLGKNVRSYVMSKSENLNMMALCRLSNQAGNMIEVISNPDGVQALQQQCAARGDLEPFKVYHVEPEEQQPVTDILNTVASSQGGNVYICANIHELLSELDSMLQQYVPGS